MKLFVGLGNIGKEYEGTRHNVGFDVVSLVETKLGRSSGWKPGKGDFYLAKGTWKGEDVVLVKPTTYMNLSGRAVVQSMQFYKVELADVVIICDDIAIPVGTLRLRLRGSDGGHNGLSSIIYDLGTNEFTRLRCGVGDNFRKGDQVRYVLSRYSPDELPLINEMIERATQGLLTIVEDGAEKAMNKINGLPEPGLR